MATTFDKRLIRAGDMVISKIKITWDNADKSPSALVHLGPKAVPDIVSHHALSGTNDIVVSVDAETTLGSVTLVATGTATSRVDYVYLVWNGVIADQDGTSITP